MESRFLGYDSHSIHTLQKRCLQVDRGDIKNIFLVVKQKTNFQKISNIALE